MDILVPIINDASGAKVFFTIELSDVKGPCELGNHSSSTIHIVNIAGRSKVLNALVWRCNKNVKKFEIIQTAMLVSSSGFPIKASELKWATN